MTGEQPCADSAFDHHAESFKADVAGTYRRLRDERPISWTSRHGGFWVAADYEHVHRIAKDTATFSSARPDPSFCTLVIPPSPSPARLSNLPEESDPPLFYRYRRPFNEVLSPGAVDRLGETVDRWTHGFIDAFVEDGECDLVRDLASPVPACVTLEWLGLPLEDWRRYSDTMHELPSTAPGSERFAKAREGMVWVGGQLRDAIRARREAPTDDIVSYFVQYGTGDERLTDDEIFSMLSIAIVGGLDTTTSLTSQAIIHLGRHPRDRERLIAEPALLESATEEFLRLYPPSMGHARTVTHDVTVGGCPMRAGDRVFVAWAAANLDPAAFPDPDTFHIDRFPNRHFSFGTGPHRCVGSHLARSMFKSMMRAVLARIPDYRVDESALVSYPDWSVVSGWEAIPVTFTPGTRRG